MKGRQFWSDALPLLAVFVQGGAVGIALADIAEAAMAQFLDCGYAALLLAACKVGYLFSWVDG